MSQSPLQDRICAPGKKRILSLDGGGIRGVISLEVLMHLEDLLRKQLGKDDSFVLADYFDLIAGTSTGAIIGTLLSMGFSVSHIKEFYNECGKSMFEPSHLLERFKWKYSDEAFSSKLKEVLGEDTTLGSNKLKTVLMVVMRNANTDHPWMVTNNPTSKFNADPLHSHLHLPLWKLVRASAAAPAYFPPEEIKIGEHEFVFIDGGISSYNSPAFRAFITATAQPFGLHWQTGKNELLVVSIGTGSVSHENMELKKSDMNLLHDVTSLVPSILLSTVQEQDMLCRLFGDCLQGPSIDREVGTMIGTPAPGGIKSFTYLRYDEELTNAGLARLGLHDIKPRDVQKLDSVAHINDLAQIGLRIAEQQINPAHFLNFS